MRPTRCRLRHSRKYELQPRMLTMHERLARKCIIVMHMNDTSFSRSGGIPLKSCWRPGARARQGELQCNVGIVTACHASLHTGVDASICGAPKQAGYSSVGRASDYRTRSHQMVPGSIPGGRISHAALFDVIGKLALCSKAASAVLMMVRLQCDTCGIRTHAGRPHRLSRPTP